MMLVNHPWFLLLQMIWWVNKKSKIIKGDVTNLAVDAITKEMKYESFAENEEL
jgi:hypothetical protein